MPPVGPGSVALVAIGIVGIATWLGRRYPLEVAWLGPPVACALLSLLAGASYPDVITRSGTPGHRAHYGVPTAATYAIVAIYAFCLFMGLIAMAIYSTTVHGRRSSSSRFRAFLLYIPAISILLASVEGICWSIAGFGE